MARSAVVVMTIFSWLFTLALWLRLVSPQRGPLLVEDFEELCSGSTCKNPLLCSKGGSTHHLGAAQE
jgi:hypothetical protein